MRQKVAEQLLTIFESLYPQTSRLKPGQVLADLLDLFVLDQDIGFPRTVSGTNGAVFDNFGHAFSP